MKNKLLTENVINEIYKTLTERFGVPIGKAEDVGPGVADEKQGHPVLGDTKVGNYGWGAELDESTSCCEVCGGMMEIDGSSCSKCGMMQSSIDESENGGRHYGHASSCTCPDCSRSYDETHPQLDEEELDQVTPPGGEKVVRALKKQKGVKNPWAVAWSMKNRGEI